MKRATTVRRLAFLGLISVIGSIFLFNGSASGMVSDPVGIYALVDKVVFEPNEQAPERVQVWGVFALAKKNDRNLYESPVRGYLYFSLQKGKEDTCRREWADLKSIAGTGQCVAFSSRWALWEQPLKVRKATDKAEAPDTYPPGFGMAKVRDTHPQAQTLRAFRDPASPIKSDTVQF